MIFIDSGYLIALANPHDALHTRARAWAIHWQRRMREPLIVTEHVLVEAVNYLSAPVYRPKSQHLADAVRREPEYQFIPASPDLLESGLVLYRRSRDKEWSLTDCISFHVMREHGVTRALAYDHHFEQAGFEALLRRDP
jgi:uncharacterized protein